MYLEGLLKTKDDLKQSWIRILSFKQRRIYSQETVIDHKVILSVTISKDELIAPENYYKKVSKTCPSILTLFGVFRSLGIELHEEPTILTVDCGRALIQCTSPQTVIYHFTQ